MLEFEQKLRLLGYQNIVGVDEVGRGCLFGPVVAACVILPENYNIEGINDSKKLSKKTREEIYEKLISETIYNISIISNEIIDEINILNASKKAMINAINEVNKQIKIDYVLIDAVKLDLNIPSESIIKGDQKSASIAAASIIAKVYRDRLIEEYDKIYPYYDLASNKGYPTKKHLEGLEKYGITPLHRLSYEPVRRFRKK